MKGTKSADAIFENESSGEKVVNKSINQNQSKRGTSIS